MPESDADPELRVVLIPLADGEKHGYAILKTVARRTERHVALGPGTLYAIIRRFVAEGVSAECDERPDPARDHERRWSKSFIPKNAESQRYWRAWMP